MHKRKEDVFVKHKCPHNRQFLMKKENFNFSCYVLDSQTGGQTDDNNMPPRLYSQTILKSVLYLCLQDL